MLAAIFPRLDNDDDDDVTRTVLIRSSADSAVNVCRWAVSNGSNTSLKATDGGWHAMEMLVEPISWVSSAAGYRTTSDQVIIAFFYF